VVDLGHSESFAAVCQETAPAPRFGDKKQMFLIDKMALLGDA
jgi:hypothetical protein